MIFWGGMADFQGRRVSFKEKICPKKSSNRSGKGSCTFASANIFFSSSFFFASNLSASLRSDPRSPWYFVATSRRLSGHIEKQAKRIVIHSTQISSPGKTLESIRPISQTAKVAVRHVFPTLPEETQGPFLGGERLGNWQPKRSEVLPSKNSNTCNTQQLPPTQRAVLWVSTIYGFFETAHPTSIKLARNDIEIYPKSRQGQLDNNNKKIKIK